MQLEFMNGCSNPKTLEIYNKFLGNAHVDHLSMRVCEGEEDDENSYEEVIVGFQHYAEYMIAYLNTSTEVGEIYISVPKEFQEAFGESEYYGLITVEGLAKMLWKLPHIQQYMIDEEAVGATLH